MESKEENILKDQGDAVVEGEAKVFWRENAIAKKQLVNYKILSTICFVIMLATLSVMYFAPCFAERLTSSNKYYTYSWFGLIADSQMNQLFLGGDTLGKVLVFGVLFLYVFLVCFLIYSFFRIIGKKGDERCYFDFLKGIEKPRKQKKEILLSFAYVIHVAFIYFGLEGVINKSELLQYWIVVGVLFVVGVVSYVLRYITRKKINQEIIKKEFYEENNG